MRCMLQIVELSQAFEREFVIKLSTTAIAPFVWLQAGSIMGRFSDNGFLMHKPTTTVKFTAWQDVDYHTLRAALTVHSLLDVYKSYELQ